MSSATPIAIDVWSDIACPWCYIGKRRLEQALARFAEADDAPAVVVTYHSFQLMPDAPVDHPAGTADYLARHKGMSLADAQRMMDHVSGVAAEVGLAYDMAAVQMTNTLTAHRLLHLARHRGVQGALKERLLAAHFVEGRHVGRDDQLTELAVEVGLDRAEVVDVLADAGRHAEEVQADVDQARRYGIGGVPFFVVDQRYGVSGAQPVDAFLEALNAVVRDRSGAPA